MQATTAILDSGASFIWTSSEDAAAIHQVGALTWRLSFFPAQAASLPTALFLHDSEYPILQRVKALHTHMGAADSARARNAFCSLTQSMTQTLLSYMERKLFADS
jgi:hypothetical protein